MKYINKSDKSYCTCEIYRGNIFAIRWRFATVPTSLKRVNGTYLTSWYLWSHFQPAGAANFVTGRAYQLRCLYSSASGFRQIMMMERHVPWRPACGLGARLMTKRSAVHCPRCNITILWHFTFSRRQATIRIVKSSSDMGSSWLTTAFFAHCYITNSCTTSTTILCILLCNTFQRTKNRK